MIDQLIQRWRQHASAMKREAHAVYLASKDSRVPWYAKAVAVCVLAYLFSPIDLIPDFIPVFGYLDDLILVPAGLRLVIRLIPAEVMAECRDTAQAAALEKKPSWSAAGVIIAVWLLMLAMLVRYLGHRFLWFR